MNVSNKEDGTEPCPEDSEGLIAYACFYFNIHGYLCLAICCFGVPTNIINIIILTKKKMRSPINTVLTGVAVSDVLTMMSYIPFVIHFNIMHGPERTPERYTHGWTWFLAIHSGLSLTTNTISIWLGVCMAIMRFVFIRSMGTTTVTNRVSVLLVIIVFALSIMTYFPYYLFIKVISNRENLTSLNVTTYEYKIKPLRLGAKDETTLEATAAWMHIIIGQILPCILITVFGGLLLLTLHESKKRTIMLKGGHVDSRLKQHKRTTVMLLTIILMTIIAELPSSILVVIGLTVESFFEKTYDLLADTIDMVALINSAINFILYCAMSKQFRDCLCEYKCNTFPGKSGKMYQTVKGKSKTTIF